MVGPAGYWHHLRHNSGKLFACIFGDNPYVEENTRYMYTYSTKPKHPDCPFPLVITSSIGHEEFFLVHPHRHRPRHRPDGDRGRRRRPRRERRVFARREEEQHGEQEIGRGRALIARI
ncbi:hypothetical protein BC936DRAFT_144043 [Jimgerdemannia flammicorona]|uniref:Uncharacterized protein n=1 Tax=Jimgerdemannia flammicorona TaxID=994334 RepID=A0A433DP69_9FUNG|nr:hypothetical protein BC936DRAFT_144043 [Jimgerdemannia flammicorona]